MAVDYSGMLASYVDEATGQPVSVQVFVGVADADRGLGRAL